MAEKVTPRFARKLIKKKLTSLGLSNRVSARTVGFSDLARVSVVYVTIHNWRPNPIAGTLREYASSWGFYVDFD